MEYDKDMNSELEDDAYMIVSCPAVALLTGASEGSEYLREAPSHPGSAQGLVAASRTLVCSNGEA